MNPEIKAQWVSALREPGRVQGKGLLRSQDGAQCCLDVLCELGVKAGVVPEPVLNGEYTEEPVFAYYDDSSHLIFDKKGDRVSSNLQWEVLPDDVMKWSGLATKSPSVPYPDGDDEEVYEVELTLANDEYELTFPQIAQLIEDSDL